MTRVDLARKIPTDRYSFDKQEMDVRAGDTVCQRGEKIGEVVAIDAVARTVDIKKTKKTAEMHPSAVFVDKTGPNSEEQADALYRLGDWVEFDGVNARAVTGRLAICCFASRRASQVTRRWLLVDGEATDVRLQSGLLASERIGPPHSGASRRRKDLCRRADDLRTHTARQESRHHGHEP